MFKPEITSGERNGVPTQSIYITGHGQYDVRTDTLALVTEHLANTPVRKLRRVMTTAYWANEGVNPELAELRRAELLFIAAEYPTLYLPGMVQELGLTVDKEGRYWVPVSPEDSPADVAAKVGISTEPASPFVADPANPNADELAAALQRGLADGSILTLEDFKAQVEAQAKIEASAQRHGHATTCTEHGGRDLAACDPDECDEAALALSYIESVRDDEADQEGTHAYTASTTDPGNCDVCHFVHKDRRNADGSLPHAQGPQDDRCAVCHRDAHRPGKGTENHGHAYVAPGELIDRARTVTHPNGVTQVFASGIADRAAGEPSIGAYQRHGDRVHTYAVDGSSLGTYVTEQGAYAAIVRSA